MKNIKKLLRGEVIILDGATGTELQKRGLPQGACPELWALKNPKVVSQVHSAYKQAGADIIYACTFGLNRLKLKEYGAKNVRELNKGLALLAKKAAKGALVAGDIGPTGQFIEPFGPLGFEEAVSIFKEQVKGLLDAGVDLFAVETMMDIQEARAALIAIKELTGKFTIVTMTYDKGGRTLNGTGPVSALVTLQSLGADALGCNCSMGPRQMVELIKAMKPYAKVPLVAKPNAGMPKLRGSRTFFDMEPREFSFFAKKLALAGANLIGGCCGTTPEHIKALKHEVKSLKPLAPSLKSGVVLSSARKSITITRNKSFFIVGESINPTGKKTFQKNLRQGKISFIRGLAREQEAAGAALLDVNVGAYGIDEAQTLKKVISLLAVSSSLPLVVDSANIEAVEAALRLYPGRALINSISGKKDKVERLLSIAAKYGAMFILLPLSGKGVPKDFKERREIIEKVFKKAVRYGFTKDDIIVDGLVMAASSCPKAVVETLKTISWCSRSFKCNTIIGLSNVSFGIPGRSGINAAFLKMAKARGLTTAIANSLDKEVMSVKSLAPAPKGYRDAADFLAYFDKDKMFSGSSAKPEAKTLSPEDKVFSAIMEGNKEDIGSFIGEALKKGITAEKIINEIIIPAINKVGRLFDKKEYFLPQLIAGAESAKTAFEKLKPYLKKGIKKSAKTAVILATVKGDIHDIGKNIVGLMLENHGFSVIDLGKDVSAQRIISEAKKRKAPVIGLSALMTTTMINMKEVINLAREQGLNCRFIAGGAVVTGSFARSVGAEYAADSVEAVRVARKISGNGGIMKKRKAVKEKTYICSVCGSRKKSKKKVKCCSKAMLAEEKASWNF